MADQGTILVVDDQAANREVLTAMLEAEGYEILVASDGESALGATEHGRPDLILLDVFMPQMNGFEVCRRLKQNPDTASIPVMFITARTDVDGIVEGFSAGGVDYVTKPFQDVEVLTRLQTHLENARLNRDLRRRNTELQETIAALKLETTRRNAAEESLASVGQKLNLLSQREAEQWGLEHFVGQSPTIARIIAKVKRLQPLSTATVLITGESGTGKELIARALHYGSPRRDEPFIPVNCSAIPSDLVESLFFGHSKGSFTGAGKDRKGYFELAEGGTLFLDEVGDMPFNLQAKLLRVLETNRVFPVGAEEEREVNVRVVAATNSELRDDVTEKRFRADLYYRLARFVAEVPPLRERREDIPLLANHFLHGFAREMGFPETRISDEAMARLSQYPFPGNIRELKNIVERSLIECDDGIVRPDNLQFLDAEFSASVVKERLDTRDPSAACESSEPDPTEEDRITAYIEARGSINNSECRQLLGTSLNHAWYLLNKMNRAGSIKRESSRRWARYVLVESTEAASG